MLVCPFGWLFWLVMGFLLYTTFGADEECGFGLGGAPLMKKKLVCLLVWFFWLVIGFLLSTAA